MPVKLNSTRRPWEPEKLGKQEGRTVDNSAFYNSALWRKTRREFLNMYPLCITCKGKGITRLASVVDHKQPMSQGGDAIDWNNLQGMCDSCHNSKSGSERHGK